MVGKQTVGRDEVLFLSGRDILDRMHARAKQGARLETMCRTFDIKHNNMDYWMRINGYTRNG